MRKQSIGRIAAGVFVGIAGAVGCGSNSLVNPSNNNDNDNQSNNYQYIGDIHSSEECEGVGVCGRWGLFQREGCNLITTDAGEKCYGYYDDGSVRCQGVCKYASENEEGKPFGECSELALPLGGCYTLNIDGREVRGCQDGCFSEMYEG